MEDDKLQAAINRARRAELLLNDELLAEAFRHLNDEYVAFWMRTEARDTDARERLWQAVQVVGKVKQHLQTAISDGKVAQAELEQIIEERKRRKLFGIV